MRSRLASQASECWARLHAAILMRGISTLVLVWCYVNSDGRLCLTYSRVDGVVWVEWRGT